MAAAAWVLLVFLVFELVGALLFGVYLACPCCWPFSGLARCSPAHHPRCPAPPCVRKCCPPGRQYHNRSCHEADDGDELQLTVVPLWGRGEMKNDTLPEDYNSYRLVSFGLCDMFQLEPQQYAVDLFALRPDGGLQLVNMDETLSLDLYCVDATPGGGTRVYRCFDEEAESGLSGDQQRVYPLTLAGSVPFLAATAIVYLLLPELQNLHGKALVCHVLSMAVAYFLLTLVQINAFDMNETKATFCFTTGQCTSIFHLRL